MSMKGYGTITITDVLDGAQIWTSTTAPTSPNYTFKIANLVGDPDAEIKIGDLIFYSYYRYTVQSISDTTVLTGSRTSIRGETGAQGTSVVSIYNQYYLSTSSTTQLDGSWVESIPDYIDGRYYWSRPVTKLSNNNVVYGTPVLETSITELMAKVTPGVGMKINYSAFNTPNSGKMYIHGYSNESPADIDGCIYWNNVKRTVPKKMINPNAILPYNKYIYIVLRLSSAAATTGTLYMVWYNSGWKYAITPTPSAVGGTWNWTETTDIVLGQFIQPGAGQDVVQAYLYNPPRTASQIKTTNASPYQYSQSAVDWYNSNGGNVVNATTMLATWADGAFSATTEINGGSIKTHTIQAKHLATNAIMSSNFQGSDNPSSPFSATGTFLDLATGNIYSPNFGIDNTYGKAYLNGEIIATSGRIGNSSATNYWEIGTKVDYNAQQSAALIGKGTAYIQVGDFQLSNGLLDTRSYDQSNQLTYPKYDNTYWDFGVQAPVLDTSTTGFVSGVDDNFIYIRKHVNTIPTLKTDWDYVFRIDKTGMIYMNDVSLDDRYALKTDVGSTYLPVSGGTITGNLTVNGTLNAIASQASKLTKTITINGTSWDGSSSTTIGTMGVQYGGTGATTFTSGYALIGNGQNAIQTRAIRNNTTAGALGWTSSSTDNTLITTNTLAYWDGRYQTSGNKSNLEYVKLGKLGTIVTLDAEDVITTSGGIIDGSLQVTDLTAGNLIVTGAGRFTNGLYGDLTGTADSSLNVKDSGNGTATTFGYSKAGLSTTSWFAAWNGYELRAISPANTKSTIGLDNVENTKLSTWAGSANLTTTKVGTLAAAATKGVDTSISAGSTSTNLPTSAAVATFVEGKGYVTSSGVTSVRVQATSPVVSSSNTAQTSTLNTTISLADAYGDTKNPFGTKTANYVLAGPSSGNAAAPSFRALVAADIPSLTKSKISDFPTTWALSNVSGADDLKAIEALSGTNGFLKKTAANTWTLDTNTYVTSSGVTSVRVQATTPVTSSVSTTQASTLDTTISLADAYGDTKNPYGAKSVGYVLAGPGSGSTAAAPTFRALVAADIPTLASSKVGLGNVTNNKQVKGLSSGTTTNNLVTWGSDGYTVADSGIAKGSVATKLTLAGTDYSVASNTITVTQANLQSAVQSTSLVLMTSAERTKLSSIQVSEGGTIDFSGVTASAPLTATVAANKTVNITHNTSGISAGTYRSVTVNTYGHVTAGTNPTSLSGYGITDAKIANGVITLGSNTITPLTAASTLDVTKLSGAVAKATADADGNTISSTYLKKSGGTMTGKLTLLGNQYSDSFSSAALDLQNSNIVGVNSIYTADASDNPQEGIHFYRDATHVDTLYAQSGKLYFTPNRAIGSNGTSYEVFASGSGSTVPEAWLSWGGRNFSASYGPIDAAMIPSLGANRLELIKAAGIEIEYSRDGGSTWTNYESADAAKMGLFSSIGKSHVIGKADSNNKATADYQLRATVTTDLASVYTTLNKFAIYVSTNGSTGCWFSLDVATKAADTTWINKVNKFTISGWSGWNIINTEGITTYGNTDSQYRKLRFTFGCTGRSGNSYGLIVMKILGFGGVGWTTPNTLAATGRLYTYDQNLNATFPAQITATQFNGTATKLSGFTNTTTSATAIDSAIQNGIFYVNGTSGIYNVADGSCFVQAYSSNWVTQIYQDYVSGQIALRSKKSGTWQSWRKVLDSENYTTYTVTKTGTGASGTWEIGISGNAATATAFNSARSITLTGDTTGTVSSDGTSGWSITSKTDRLSTVGDNRSVATVPNDYVNKFIFQGLKTNSKIGSPATNSYSYVIGLRGWSDSSGGNAHELAFNDNGIFRRNGATTTWGSWYKLLDSGNYNSYAPTLTGTGASGSWGISITGNAATATTAQYSYHPGFSGGNEIRFAVSSKPSDATDLYVGYKWSDGTLDAKINRYRFCNGNAALAEVVASTFYGDLSGNATSATKATQDGSGNTITSTYAKLSGATFTGAVTGTGFGASSYVSVNTGNSGTAGGLALYGTAPTTYGIAMRGTGNGGKHGYVQGDWAIYSYMSGADNCGWVLHNSSTNVASVSNLGNAVFNGSVTVGGNTTNDSGCRMEYNATTKSLDFIFN